MKKSLTILLLILSGFLQAQDDAVLQANEQEVFVHLNQPYYISGQKVWFSLFLYNSKTQRFVSGRKFLELRLVDKESKVLIQSQVKVQDGRSQGQFNLPAELKTHEYLLHLGFQAESPDQYVYAEKIKVFNRSDVLNSPSELHNNQVTSPDELEQGASIQFNSKEQGPKQRIAYDLVLTDATEAHVSIQISKIAESDEHMIGQDATGLMNLRSQRSLDLKQTSDHQYLQFDLTRVSPEKDSIFPLAFIPEYFRQIGFLKAKGDQFTIDATYLPGGLNTFYFNQFIYRAYIPPDLEWDYEKERHKYNFVPYYEGEMTFEWNLEQPDFKGLIKKAGLRTPEITSDVVQFGSQLNITELLVSSSEYPVMDGPYVKKDSMDMEPLFWKETSDYAQMDNMAEFLFEVVTGVKAYYTDSRKDIRVLNADGPYHHIPMVTVNGVPTRDMAKVLDIPIENVEGVGVIKDHKSGGQRKYNEEAMSYGAFASTGLIVIKLKPDVINPFRSDFDKMLKRETFISPLKYPNLSPSSIVELGETPDLRTTLLWEPELALNRKKTNLSFYTSDIPGVYEIIVNGVKKGGGLIRIKKTFEVSRSY